MLSLKLVESDNVITAKIYKAYAKELEKHFRSVSGSLLSSLRPIIASALSSSPEIQSMSGGLLQADFGLTSNPGQSIVSSIISTLALKTEKVSTNGKIITGGFTVVMQPQDYSNLFSLPVATQIIEGGSLPWLKWLLTLGDTIIIANFGVEYGPYGRTGRARMTEESRPFKVNSAFSGTVDDNFITRAIQRSKSQIINAIIKAVK
jgi:hypothetical protein